jgi:hypothetical protein
MPFPTIWKLETFEAFWNVAEENGTYQEVN